jgi:outer membrane autotransporter protein
MISTANAIEPNINLHYANTKQDGFTESGPGGLSVGSSRYNTRRLGVGVRIVNRDATARLRPYLSVGYQREFGDTKAELTNSLGGLTTFGVDGSNLGKNIWTLRLGADARINDRFSIVGEIGGSWRKNQDSRYIYGGVKYGW